MRIVITILLINFSALNCIAQTNKVQLSYPQHQALANTASYNKLLSVDTLLIFNDQFTKYYLLKETKYRNDTIIINGDFKFSFKSDTSDFWVEYPKFAREYFELIPPFIDTVRHSEDRSVIIRIDTYRFFEEDFAQSYTLDSTTYYQTMKTLQESFANQHITIEEILLDCDNKKKGPFSWKIKNEHIEKCKRIKVDFLLSKSEEMMVYPIIFIK